MPDFAALEARVNRAVAGHLANASLVFQGGVVAVVFGPAEDEASVPGGLGRGGLGSPRRLGEFQASAPAEDLGATNPVDGQSCTLDGTPYVVTRQPVTDSSGWMTVRLRRQA